MPLDLTKSMSIASFFFKFIDSINKFAIAKIIALTTLCSSAIYLTQDKVSLSSLFVTHNQPVASEVVFRFETISLPQVLQYFNNPETFFLDVRAKQFYDYGHINGAINLPAETIPQLTEEQVTQWKGAPAVIVYCNGVSCGTGYLVARRLMEKGLDNVKVYVEGWPEWRSCRLPITMSDQMKKDVAKEKR
jgi:rhodanese-related sulfurtransferase